ncbi:hypothetical protein MMC31_007844 [Peltigera leucophlebia]|nr:hypothetical protein [Peltigera leucophlebia]
MSRGRLRHTSYEQSVRLLLNPITSDHELHDMLNDGNNALWKSDDMADALRERLGDAHPAYMQTIQQIKEIILSLAKKLDIEGADQVSQQGLEVAVLAYPPSKKDGIPDFQIRKFINFLWQKKIVIRLLDELDECIRRLDTYANKAEKLELYKAERQSDFALSLGLIEGNATRLYEVLSRTWCSAHTSHHAGLLLNNVWSRSERPASKLNTQKNAMSTALGSHYSKDRLRGSGSISVVQVVVPASPRTPSSDNLYLESSQLQVVTNLCSVLQKPNHPQLGFYLDSNDDLRGVYSAQSRALTYIENAVSLGEMLAKRQVSLSKEEVYSLSITLSSSLLQLSHTPWLGQSLDKADIIFLRAKDGSASSVDVKHPYLTREHKSDKARLIRHNRNPGNDSSKLLALGVLLIEVNASQPFENLRLPQDIVHSSEPNELTNVLTGR